MNFIYTSAINHDITKVNGTVVVIWFCLATASTRASTLLSWVALWTLGFVRASVRARKGGCGSGSSLALFLLKSYRSDLGGVAAGLTVLGTLSRSGIINIASVTFLCDKESAV
jgi:hypothetical protein